MGEKEKISPEETAFKLQTILTPALEGFSIHEIKEVFRLTIQGIEHQSLVSFKKLSKHD